jgi:WD40 repeat protein
MSSDESLKYQPFLSETLESMKPTSLTSNKKSTLFLACKDGFLRSHTLNDLSTKTLIKTSLSSIECLFVDSSDNIWAGGDSGEIQKYSLSEKPELYLEGHNDTIVSIHLDSSEKLLYSTSEDRTVRRWDLSNGNNETLYLTSYPIVCADFNETLQTIALCTTDEELVVFNVFDLKNQVKIPAESKIWCLKIVDSRDWIIEGNGDGLLVVRNLKNLARVRELKGHESRVKCIDLNSDQKFAVTGSFDQMVLVWDLNELCLKYSFEGPNDWVRGVVIHPEFKYVYSVSDDCIISMWEIPKDDQPYVLKGISENREDLFMKIVEFLVTLLLAFTYYFGLNWDIRHYSESLLEVHVYYSQKYSLKVFKQTIINTLKAIKDYLFTLLSSYISTFIQICITSTKKLFTFLFHLIIGCLLLLISIPATLYVKLKQLL